MAALIQWREPDEFTSGDTLLFQRSLPDYLPSDGWALRLTITQPLPQGALKVAEAVSVADSTNSVHTFNVPDFCAALEAGVYVLSEVVFNQSTGEKHQIYHDDEFNIGDDLDSGLVVGPILTEAQEMIALLRASYKALIQQQFASTNVQHNEFVLQKQGEVLDQLKYWKNMRINEIQMERAKNGQKPGNVQEAVFCIG